MDLNSENDKATKEELSCLKKTIETSFTEEYRDSVGDESLEELDGKKVPSVSCENPKKNKKESFTKILEFICFFVFAGFLFVITLVVVKNILDLGEYLKRISIYLTYASYVLLSLLLFVLLYLPIIRLFSFPYICSHKEGFRNERHNKKVYRKIAKRMLTSEEYKKIIKISKKNRDGYCYQELIRKFNSPSFKKGLNQIILKYSRKTLVSTSVSQREILDTLFIFIHGFRLIYEIFRYCGYRTSFIRITKLSFRIMLSAFFAYELNGCSSIHLFDDKVLRISKKITVQLSFLNGITDSLLDGITNSLCMLKIGIITKNYLMYELNWNMKKNAVTDFFVSSKETIQLFALTIFEPIGKLAKKVVEKVIHSFNKKNTSEI